MRQHVKGSVNLSFEVLFVVEVFAEHGALLAQDFAPVFKAVANETY